MTSTASAGSRLGSAPVELTWAAMEWPGLEHVIASYGPAGFTADSWLILISEAGPARVSYRLACDRQWQVTTLDVRVTDATSDRTLALTHDGAGHWHADGRRRPDLDGCVDVDINRSPLTNTMPIRRMGNADKGVAYDLVVAYVELPELTVRPVGQRYTLVDADRPVYRYESGSYRADLPVDGDGFVIDYPGLWSRVAQPAVSTAE